MLTRGRDRAQPYRTPKNEDYGMPGGGFTLETEFLRRKDNLWRWACIGGTILNAIALPLVVWLMSMAHEEQLRIAVNAAKMTAGTVKALLK